LLPVEVIFSTTWAMSQGARNCPFLTLIGLPVLPPYYTLRLLPYMVPQLSSWKRQLLREGDIVEAEGLDLLG
jgi:hypothetical protein